MKIVRSTIAADEVLGVIANHYGFARENALCELEYRGVNDIYKYTDGVTSSYLKVYARTGLTREEVEGEVEIVNHLKYSGLSVAYPIPTINGQYILVLDVPEGTRFGVLFSEAQGSALNNNTLEEGETLAIGRLLSTMHSKLDAMPTTPKRWKLDEALFLDRSMEILEQHSRFNKQVDLPFIKEVVTELKKQIGLQRVDWKWGLCHGDIYAGNIHRNATSELTIFDFDFCGYGWRAYDLASFLGNFSWGVTAEAIEKRKRRLEWFRQGYTCANGLSNSEVEAVYKIFVPFRRIFNMGYLYAELQNVWGNRLRNEQIILDTRLLKDWVGHYW